MYPLNPLPEQPIQNQYLVEIIDFPIFRRRRRIVYCEAQSHGKSIFDYAPSCKGAIAYESLAQEVVNKEEG